MGETIETLNAVDGDLSDGQAAFREALSNLELAIETRKAKRIPSGGVCPRPDPGMMDLICAFRLHFARSGMAGSWFKMSFEMISPHRDPV